MVSKLEGIVNPKTHTKKHAFCSHILNNFGSVLAPFWDNFGVNLEFNGGGV